MTFEEYTGRFSSLKSEILRIENQKKLLLGQEYQRFLEDADAAGALADLPKGVFLHADAERKLRRAWRLYRKYLVRIGRACDRIHTPGLREVALYHYLYGMSYEEIARLGHYSNRTVYRRALEVRRQLKQFLLAMMPRPVRTPPRRYRLSPEGKRRIAAGKRASSPGRAAAQRPFTVRPERAVFGKTEPGPYPG